MRELEREAEDARTSAEAASAPILGRLYNDVEGGIMEEAERNLEAAMATPDALQVLAELNKKKELKAVDHSKVDYIPFKKNLYIVPRALARLSNDEVTNMRGKLKVRVRGHGAPAPVCSFEQCGLSERIMKVMETQKITSPFPIQAQCLPCVMAGRDVIGIAKTGSGKVRILPLLNSLLYNRFRCTLFWLMYMLRLLIPSSDSCLSAPHAEVRIPKVCVQPNFFCCLTRFIIYLISWIRH